MVVFQDCEDDPLEKGIEFYSKFNDFKEGIWLKRSKKALMKAKVFAMNVMREVDYLPNNQQMAVAISILCSMHHKA